MNEKQYDWSFGFQYLIACAVGVALLGMVAFFAMWSIGEAVEGFAGETVALIVAGSLFGALIALGASVGTGMLLRSQGVEPGKWIGYSVVAGGIGGALGFGLVTTFSNLETVPESLAGLMMGLTVGLPLGIGQWLALRQAGVGASVWPLITTLAFILAFSASFAMGGEGREWIAVGGMGLIYGAITALGMVWLLGSNQTAMAA